MKTLFLCLCILLFAVPTGATTWYVRTGGSDSHSCAQAQTNNDANAKASLTNGSGTGALDCVGTSAGAGADDIVEVAAGTYDIGSTLSQEWEGREFFPKGTSWTHPFTLKCASVRACTLTSGAGGVGSSAYTFIIWATSGSSDYYAVIDGFIWDLSNGARGIRFGSASGDASFIKLSNNTFSNAVIAALFTGGPSSLSSHDYIITNNIFTGGLYDDSGGVGGNYAYPIYLSDSSNALVEGNEFSFFPSFGIQVNPNLIDKDTNHIFRNNYFHHFSSCNTPPNNPAGASAIVLFHGGGNQVYNNIINCGGQGIRESINGNSTTPNLIYNNTIYGTVDNGVYAGIETAPAGNSPAIVKNNIINNITGNPFGSYTGTTSNNFCPSAGSGCSSSGDPSFVNPGSDNFSLSTSSTAIDAGTSSITSGVTLSCAGNCDMGVYEVPKFSSCTATSNTLSIVFDNPRFPPITNLATTGISLTVDGTSRSLTSPVLNGTNQVDFTFSGAAAKSTASATGTSAAITDSANIGGSTSNVQKVKDWTSTACTVTGGGGGIVLTQTHFRFHDLPGTEASPRCLSASGSCSGQEDVNYSVQRGGCFRLRLKMACTGGDCAAGGFICRYSKNAGGYSVVPDSFDSNNIRLYGTGVDPEVPSQGTQTTELLTSSHATNVAGAIIRTSVAIPNIDLSQNSESELEYVMCIDSDESVGTTYDFRLYNQNGAALDTYSVTPRATVVLPRMKGHGLAL